MNERDERMAMEGILVSQSATSQSARPDPGDVAQWARTYADVLIAELVREQVAGGQ